MWRRRWHPIRVHTANTIARGHIGARRRWYPCGRRSVDVHHVWKSRGGVILLVRRPFPRIGKSSYSVDTARWRVVEWDIAATPVAGRHGVGRMDYDRAFRNVPLRHAVRLEVRRRITWTRRKRAVLRGMLRRRLNVRRWLVRPNPLLSLRRRRCSLAIYAERKSKHNADDRGVTPTLWIYLRGFICR